MEPNNRKSITLQERGLFWWADENVPKGQFAPDSCIGGELCIDGSGRVTLDLDGVLTAGAKGLSLLASSEDPALKSRSIQGLLKNSSKHILLSDLSRRGSRFSTSNVSFEGFMALRCLIGDRPFPQMKREPTVSFLEVNLKGFEEWLRLGSIYVKRGPIALRVRYRRAPAVHYLLAVGTLSIRHGLLGPTFRQSRESALSLDEFVMLRFKRSNPITLTEALADYQTLQDLFVLLTDSAYNLQWPTVAVTGRQQCKLYFQRALSDVAPPRAHETITSFIDLKTTFGELFGSWLKKRETFGPGFYLYLGNRRGMKIYVEHRFIMLIWGLEAFHRTKYELTKSRTIAAQIERVLAQIPDGKDKKWLTKQLAHAADPNLAQRLFEVLKSVPLGLEEARLRRFAESCATARNDISHFGIHRDKEMTYNDFILDLDKKSDALDYIYHALILREIGLEERILLRWYNESFYSFQIKLALSSVDLMDRPGPGTSTP